MMISQIAYMDSVNINPAVSYDYTKLRVEAVASAIENALGCLNDLSLAWRVNSEFKQLDISGQIQI